MKVQLTIFASMFLALCTVYANGDSWETEMTRANALYTEGAYSSAIEKYTSILEAEWISKSLFVNMSNAHYQEGNTAEAIYYLEKARLYYPNDTDITSRISLMREELGIDIIEIPDFVLNMYWREFSKLMRPLGWFSFEVLFALASLFFLYKWQLGSMKSEKPRYFLLSVSCGILFVLASALGNTSDQLMHDSGKAVLMKPDQLYAGADERSETLRSMSAGMPLKVQDELTGWVKVELPNKEQGWVPSSSIREV